MVSRWGRNRSEQYLNITTTSREVIKLNANLTCLDEQETASHSESFCEKYLKIYQYIFQNTSSKNYVKQRL